LEESIDVWNSRLKDLVELEAIPMKEVILFFMILLKEYIYVSFSKKLSVFETKINPNQ